MNPLAFLIISFIYAIFSLLQAILPIKLAYFLFLLGIMLMLGDY